MEQHTYEGTSQELASFLAQHPDRRFRLTDITEGTKPAEDALDAKLRQRQQQDGTTLMPDISTQVLFAQWAEEDAHMTDSEREAEDRLWQDIEQGLVANSGLRLRHLGE